MRLARSGRLGLAWLSRLSRLARWFRNVLSRFAGLRRKAPAVLNRKSLSLYFPFFTGHFASPKPARKNAWRSRRHSHCADFQASYQRNQFRLESSTALVLVTGFKRFIGVKSRGKTLVKL